MKDITVKTADMNNNNNPTVCKFIWWNTKFVCSKKNKADIWKPVLILPRLFTLSDIFAFSSANLCLMAITRNSLEMIIIEESKKIIESNDFANTNIVITTKSLSAIGSRKAPKAVVWL